jgi:hypothetical protein
MAGLAELSEIRASWTILDVINYNCLLDAREENDLAAAERQAERADEARVTRSR